MRTGLADQHVPNLRALLHLKTKQTFQQITKTLESLRSFAFARRPGIGLGYWMGWAVTPSPDTSASHPPCCSMENKSAGSTRGARFSQMLKHMLRAIHSVKEVRAWELHGAGATLNLTDPCTGPGRLGAASQPAAGFSAPPALHLVSLTEKRCNDGTNSILPFPLPSLLQPVRALLEQAQHSLLEDTSPGCCLLVF